MESSTTPALARSVAGCIQSLCVTRPACRRGEGQGQAVMHPQGKRRRGQQQRCRSLQQKEIHRRRHHLLQCGESLGLLRLD